MVGGESYMGQTMLRILGTILIRKLLQLKKNSTYHKTLFRQQLFTSYNILKAFSQYTDAVMSGGVSNLKERKFKRYQLSCGVTSIV